MCARCSETAPSCAPSRQAAAAAPLDTPEDGAVPALPARRRPAPGSRLPTPTPPRSRRCGASHRRSMEPDLSFRGRRALVTGAGKGGGGGRESGRGRAGPGLTASPRRDRTRRGRGAVQGRSASNGAEPHRGGPGEPRTRGTDGPDPPPPPRTPPAPRGAAEPGPRRSAPGSNRCAWTWPTGTPRRRRWARRGPSSCW